MNIRTVEYATDSESGAQFINDIRGALRAGR